MAVTHIEPMTEKSRLAKTLSIIWFRSALGIAFALGLPYLPTVWGDPPGVGFDTRVLLPVPILLGVIKTVSALGEWRRRNGLRSST